MIAVDRLEAKDWTLYRDLRLASLLDAPSAFGSRLVDERERAEAEWRDRLARRTQFVVREAGGAVGTAGWYEAEDGAAELVSMWVAPTSRGMGVGDRLVEAVMTDARRAGCEPIRLWVSDGNRPAERLYERNGFERTGRRQPIDEADPSRGTEFEMVRRGARR
jgi:ribosomal protein S18 acetylase RimI-like enzyme